VTVLAYYKGIRSYFERFGKLGKITQHICTLITILFIIFDMYILTVVFIDSCHFITRMLIFTFTGFIAYPSTTYGYFVFIITVFMYITESVHHIRSTYSKLFKYVNMTVFLCNKLILSLGNIKQWETRSILWTISALEYTLLRCEHFLNKGIPNNLKLSTSPLTIDIRTKARLGSVYNIERQSGYDKLTCICMAKHQKLGFIII
jgi:hypothetical protein